MAETEVPPKKRHFSTDNHGEVSITELYKLSAGLLEIYFKNQEFYALLVLAMVTVTEYSRTVRHLDTPRRIELTITYIPDLVNRLVEAQVLTEKQGRKLMKKVSHRENEIPLILEAYVYVAGGLRTKIDQHREAADVRCRWRFW